MKLLATITAAAAATASLAYASTITDPSGLSASVNTFDLSARSLKKMDGKCTPKGGCKVPGGLHSAYPCWNSKCNTSTTTNANTNTNTNKGAQAGVHGEDDTGKDCVIAPGMDGAWVAKCPTNLLPYEWEWPWVPPKKDKDGKDKQ